MSTDWSTTLRRVRTALLRRGRSEHDADDLLQEAWVRLACFERDHPVEKPEAFLMRTALNLSIDAHRAQQVRGEELPVEDTVVIDTSPSAESVVLGRERVQRLSICLSRLPEKTRAIFLAHRIEEKSYQQIAAEQGLSVSTVEGHVSKALLRITVWMEGW